MENSFFKSPYTDSSIVARLKELNEAKVGFYSVGLYPGSLAYNCVMQAGGKNLLLSPRPGRDLFGAFNNESIKGMDPLHLAKIEQMSTYQLNDKSIYYTLSDLILKCELIVLSSNSKDSDMNEVTRKFGCMSIDSIIFTKLDESATYGSIFNHTIRFKKPLSYLTLGQKVPEDLETASRERLVDLLLNISGT